MKTLTIDYKLNPKQRAFMETDGIDEVCYGGAAGGGKTFIQCLDSLRYALQYPGSNQLVIRRTFPELRMNIEKEMKAMFPDKSVCRYNESQHTWKFKNGSIIELGYLARESSVFLYQGSQWHCIRIDECTHIPYSSIEYLRTRIRGADDYPKGLRLSTNPGNIGHMWVKNLFVDPVPPFYVYNGSDDLSRLYIPASVYDNKVLMENDPKYVKRLESTSDPILKEQLLFGNWDISAGAYFAEFNREDHVRAPFDFTKNKDVKLYRSIDYGLDMLACLWYAELPPSSVNPHGKIFVYRELNESNLTISDAVKRIKEATPPEERIICTYAPPDVLNNRDRVSGRNQGDIFRACGLTDLVKSNNDRVAGWMAIKELIEVRETGEPILEIFSYCTKLIKHLPMIEHDDKVFNDTKREPHEITHNLDSLRYFAIQWHDDHPIREVEEEDTVEYGDEMLKDYRRASPAQRLEIEKMMGGKPRVKW